VTDTGKKTKTTSGYDVISVFIEIAQLPQLPLIELADSVIARLVIACIAASRRSTGVAA